MKDWIERIDETTKEFQDLAGSLTAEELNWKPNAESWSIAQILDHLIVINQSYFPILADLRSGKYQRPFIARFGFVVSFFGKVILKSVQPDNLKKIKTFSIWEPSKSHISPDILDRFVKHQTELKKEIDASQDQVLKGAIISSPANKNIVYKLETAFEIIVTHEQRHLKHSKGNILFIKN